MKRGFRIAFTALCIAVIAMTVVLWARSTTRQDSATYVLPHGRGYEVVTGPHRILLQQITHWPSTRPAQLKPHGRFVVRSALWGESQAFSVFLPRANATVGNQDITIDAELLNMTTMLTWSEPTNSWLGFGWQSGGVASGQTLLLPMAAPAGWRVALPFWFVILLAGIVPSREVLSWQCRRRRSAANQCLGCGYDLRATPERCPECGAVRRPR